MSMLEEPVPALTSGPACSTILFLKLFKIIYVRS